MTETNRSLTVKSKPVAKLPQAKAKQYSKEAVSKKVSGLWNTGVGLMEKSAAKFIECGKVLLDAQANMSADDFTSIIRDGSLPFNENKAYRLLKIASDPEILSNTERLPKNWTVLYELTKLENGQLTEMIKGGEIMPDSTAGDVKKAAHKSRGNSSKYHDKTPPADQEPLHEDDDRATRFLKLAAQFKRLQEEWNGEAESALLYAFGGMDDYPRADVLEGLRFAIELHDTLVDDNTASE